MEVLPDDVPATLTPKQVRGFLLIDSDKKLYDKLKEPDFPSIKDGGRWIISAKRLDEYLAEKIDNNDYKKSA